MKLGTKSKLEKFVLWVFTVGTVLFIFLFNALPWIIGAYLVLHFGPTVWNHVRDFLIANGVKGL